MTYITSAPIAVRKGDEMGKPTVHDIAREAGVSLATVDRVLNARSGVRTQTVERVQGAIRKLGFVRDMSAANLARSREYTFAFVLPDSPSQFVSTLRAALRDVAETQIADRTTLRVIPAATHDPHAMVQVLAAIDPRRCDGVAIMAPETPQLRDQVARLKAAGLAVVALVSDQPNSERDHFVGINNTAAGRTAGVLMGRFLPQNKGKVLAVAASMLARDSIERRGGFGAVLAADFPAVTVLPSVEAHDDPDRMDRVLRSAFAAHPDIVGIYALASGNQALLKSLAGIGRANDLVVIVHELTPVTRAALETGQVAAVITQDVGHLVRSALRVLRARSDGQDIVPAQERIRIEIMLRENLP